MEIRKMAVGGVMIGAIAAAGLGLAGTASATPQWHPQPKPPVVSHQKTVTVTKTSTTSVSNTGQLGNGNTQQTASGAAGAINNPQLGVAASIPVSLNVPVLSGNGVNTGDASHKASTKAEGGNAGQDVVSVAKANESDNSTKVNNANGNGNGSSVSIGSSN